MGLDLFESYPSARRLFQQADDLLGFPLSQLCFRGPEDELRQTVNAQPAIFTVSLAAWAALAEEVGAPLDALAYAGHSLGEYTALVAAGAMSFAEGLSLVRERGRLMQAAADARPGGMMAILGLGDALVDEVCRTAAGHGVAVVANYNAPGQVVISGELPALERAAGLARERGARRVMPLPVSGAFHSPLMEPAAQALGRRLSTTTFCSPKYRIFANVTGLCYGNGNAIPDLLVQQVTSPVRWVACAKAIAGLGVDAFVEVGPGQVLGGLIKRIVPDAGVESIGTTERVRRFPGWLAGLPAKE
ncbi:MAG: ACP S-malonyltransferase [Chloroflexi bacterium]|nr:ACP S-malonyltransferase [Chloroflexota bacterium]